MTKISGPIFFYRAELSGEHPIATDLKARMIAARAPLAGAWVGSMS